MHPTAERRSRLSKYLYIIYVHVYLLMAVEAVRMYVAW